MPSYRLDFVGHWPVRARGVADQPGVYCIYASTPVSSHLVYIGQSHSVESRIFSHPRLNDWLLAANGHPLYFSSGLPCPPVDIHIAEAAMIHHYKPICNTMNKYDFPHPATTIFSTGPIAILNQAFTVYTN